jgi:hypothetical protein
MDRAEVGAATATHAAAEGALDIRFIVIKELVFMPSPQP